jgi:small subunit ribosomal protein S13
MQGHPPWRVLVICQNPGKQRQGQEQKTTQYEFPDNIPLNKRVEVGLTYIYGIGRSTSQKVLDKTGVSPDTYVKDLTDGDVISSERSTALMVEGDLRRERLQDVKRLMEIGTYRGMRHRRGSARRGQRTKTNARGRRWRRRARSSRKEGRAQPVLEQTWASAPQGPQEHPLRPGPSRLVHQHHRHAHGPRGQRDAWESAGGAGFKGSASPRPAAQVTAEAAAQKGMEHGPRRSRCS